jgi:hypothetical protein
MKHYYLLDRSGPRVSRPALGTMNFGVDGFHAAYGKTEEESEAILWLHRRLLHRGGSIDRDRPDGVEPDARQRLDEASAPAAGLLYLMFTTQYQSWAVNPGLGIGDKPATYHPPVFNGLN